MDDGGANDGGVTSWTIGGTQLLRVPYFDIALPPDALRLTAEDVQQHPLADPAWLAGDGNVLVGQAFWVIQSGGRMIVVDPCAASDAFLRSGPGALDHQDAAFAALRAAGVDPERVDTVALTHLDGIGMAALVTDVGWAPAFPAARLVVTEQERAHIADRAEDVSGSEVFEELVAQGVVDAVVPPHQLADGVTLELTAGHSPGHAVVAIQSADEEAVLIGHLAVTPLHLSTPGTDLHDDVPQALAAVNRWLDRASQHATLVAGSLWPSPGAVRVSGTEPLRLVPDHGTVIS